MKYAVIHTEGSGRDVATSWSRFQWISRIRAAGVRRRSKGGLTGHNARVQLITSDPATIVEIYQQRNELEQEALKLSQQVIELRQQVAHAAQALFPLVARNEAGEWCTVRPADDVVNEEESQILDLVLNGAP